jgi:Na+/glutamate symporter
MRHGVVVGHMKRLRKREIRLIGLTLGTVVAGVAGGPCTRLLLIKFRFRKGTVKLYCSNLVHISKRSTEDKDQALHNFH